VPEEKTESGIPIEYIFIGPELFSPTRRVFSKKVGTGMQHMHLKSQCAMTHLMERAQVMRFFDHVKNFNGTLIIGTLIIGTLIY
jgi:hypothetical protein